jgi:hypothetical protein
MDVSSNEAHFAIGNRGIFRTRFGKMRSDENFSFEKLKWRAFLGISIEILEMAESF